MVQIELTSSQEQTLTALVNRYRADDGPVKGQTVADDVDRSLGTVQNQMQSLAQLGLVDSLSGPEGGYVPTELAYDALDRDPIAETETVTLAREYERIDVTVDRITFKSVHHPEACRAQLHLQQSVADFTEGQAVAAGPTPNHHLVVAGTVEAVDDTSNTLIVDVAQVEAPVEPPE
ncbi:TrmB family transcriptional regulator [Haloarcula litorea]|uniref:TrmB family transcriptional regulator n=1 Tax=Haloarcula litorea TaxID=3032579 RepID=UPI0023E8F8CD|nr:TrmB family transcriptional regulator [Halomicroarcula sp. GDY20]